MTFRMWLENVVEEDGTIVEQLQYKQVMFFVFHFGTDEGSTFWPHSQVSTLRRQKEGDDSKEFKDGEKEPVTDAGCPFKKK